MAKQTQPQITFFNRHESMDSETRGMILDIINDLYDCPLGHSTYTMQNWLYGSFDGYDYSDVALNSNELNSIRIVDAALATKLTQIFYIISIYPRTANPNNNKF